MMFRYNLGGGTIFKQPEIVLNIRYFINFGNYLETNNVYLQSAKKICSGNEKISLKCSLAYNIETHLKCHI